MSNLRLASILALSALSAALTGCGVTTGTPSIAVPLAAISGRVHGGQQPISGAQVYLYAAGTGGYGSAPTSLLNSPGYVTTDADGNFSFNGAYSLANCQTAQDLVYLVSVGGNPGAGSANPNAVLMAALGDCANLTASTFVYVSEVTSVASVYALQQFMSPGTYNVGTTSTNLTGLQNAFLTVPNLVSPNNGAALVVTPAGNGVVPQQELNTLANIIAACVSSTSPFTACSSLYTAATPTNGTAPTDTFGAILDIALNPAQNINALYTLPPPAVPFLPALTAQPNDWTISVNYTGGGMSAPRYLAADGFGNIWVSDFAGSTSGVISEFNVAGVSQQGSNGLSANVPPYPGSLAITPAGYIWVNGSQTVPNSYAYPIVELSGAGSLTASFIGFCENGPIVSDKSGSLYTGNGDCKITSSGTLSSFVNASPTSTTYGGLAIDEQGNFWLPGQYQCPSACGSLVEITSAGALSPVEPATGWVDGLIFGTFGYTLPVAIDAQGDAWTTGPNSNLVEISPSGAILSPPSSTGYFGSGYPLPNTGASAVAVDGANSIWTSNSNGTISHFLNSGTMLSPSNGYLNTSPRANYSYSMALDSAGNLWTAAAISNTLVEWVGVAAPVKTPLAQNLVSNSIGQRP